jgi:hypothetical protein
MRYSFFTLFTATSLLFKFAACESGKEPVELEDGSICVEGYIMDKWCIETLGYLLDRGRNFPTLETADQHSVHCLADVGVCINSGYEVLTVERGSDGRFGRQVTLDQYGNEATRALSLQVEKEGQLTGFRATVVGTWDDTVQDDPPVLKVNQVFRSEVGCDGPMPTTSEPGLPPPPPTSAPVVNGQEDITMGETDCTGLTARVQIRQNPLVELSYTAVLDDPEGYEEATLPNGNITAELVLHRGEGWIGMGISGSYPNMIPGEVVIGLPDASSVMQYDLSSRSLPGVNAAAGGQQLTDTNIVQNSTHTVLTFTRRLVEEGRLPFDANEENGLIWAVGFDNELGFHQFFGGVSLNLLICVPGEGIVNPDDAGFQNSLSETPKMSVLEAHGNILTIAWGLLAPLAIGSALLRGLFIKAGYDKLWFQIHMFLNTTVFILTLIGFIMAFAALNKVDADHFEKTDETPHQLVGLIIMILVFVQVANGVFRPHLPPAKSEDFEPKNDSSDGGDASPVQGEKSLVRKIWEPSHKILGVVLLALSWWQVTTGWDTFSTLYAEEDYTHRLWAMVGTIGGIILIGKVYQVAKTD